MKRRGGQPCQVLRSDHQAASTEQVRMHVACRYVQDVRSVRNLRDGKWWASTLAPLRGSAATAAAAAAIARAAAGGAGVQQVRA